MSEIPLISDIKVEELEVGKKVTVRLSTGQVVTVYPFTPIRMFRKVGAEKVTSGSFDLSTIFEVSVEGVNPEDVLFRDFTPLLEIVDHISGGILSTRAETTLFQKE